MDNVSFVFVFLSVTDVIVVFRLIKTSFQMYFYRIYYFFDQSFFKEKFVKFVTVFVKTCYSQLLQSQTN